MLISAAIGGVLVIFLCLLGCCCYRCMRKCECDCDCSFGFGRGANPPADECKEPKPHYSLNIDEFYDKKGGDKKKGKRKNDKEIDDTPDEDDE